MDIGIFNKNFELHLYGYSGIAVKQNWGEFGFTLMDKMWKQVKSNNLKNKGINIWVYEPGNYLFTGVQLEETPTKEMGLEEKKLILEKYAYYKHIGSYTKVGASGSQMREEIKKRGFMYRLPCIEMYGHWQPDESKLETEIIWCLE